LPTFFIKLLTKPGDLVLDPFAGTCTTAVAAEKLGRRWLATEIDKRYTDVLVQRLATGR
jgi:site-specific DNA-methyltransferase (cytosine-N4-specific)